jgi:very-short-patch-repair endonuclease
MRDRRITRLLRCKGWKVLRIWGHSLAYPERVAIRIIYKLSSTAKRCDTSRRKQ